MTDPNFPSGGAPPNQNPPQQYPPPYGYPYPPYGYPYPNMPPPGQTGAPPDMNNSNNNNGQQNAPPQNFPGYPPYPYPPYPYPPPQQQQQQGNDNQQGQQQQQPNQMPQYPYPPPGYPPYPYPPYGYPPQQNSNNQPNNQQQQNMPPPYQYPPQAYPPYPYPPSYGYPPQQQQQPVQQQQQPHNNERMMFDWERAKLPGQGFQNNSPSHPMNQQQPNMNQPPPAKQSAFDWENGGAAQPQKPIEIDWNYKSEYDVPDVPPDVTRDPSVTAICTSRAFDPSTLPKLDDSFFKLFPSDAAAELRAQKMRSTFQKRGNSKSRETFRIKFQFDDDNISDLSVSATFHVNELTYKLYDFLSEVVFMEGTKFLLRNTFPAKVIASAHNQRLKDVKVTGNCILIVKISHFTGLKDDVNTQYSMQKAAIAEQIQKLEAEKQQPQSE